MFQNKAPQSSEVRPDANALVGAGAAGDLTLNWSRDSYTCAGKVFLLGEYAVLGGAPAILASVGPRFRLSAKAVPSFAIEDSESDLADLGTTTFHPQSPVARLVDWSRDLGLPEFQLHFEDSHGGMGGFGASTAQFALTYRALAQVGGWELSWEKVWHHYRELTRNASQNGPQNGANELPPSGADLIAQWHGGVVLVHEEFQGVDQLWNCFDWSRLLVFSATGQEGRKVATHEHLKTLKDLSLCSAESPLVAELRTVVEEAVRAVGSSRVKELGLAMNRYAEILAEQGLEVAAAREDREALGSLPGVAGIKGSGAMQSDALLILMEPDFSKSSAKRKAVIEAATARNLSLVCDGLDFQTGVACPS